MLFIVKKAVTKIAGPAVSFPCMEELSGSLGLGNTECSGSVGLVRLGEMDGIEFVGLGDIEGLLVAVWKGSV